MYHMSDITNKKQWEEENTNIASKEERSIWEWANKWTQTSNQQESVEEKPHKIIHFQEDDALSFLWWIFWDWWNNNKWLWMVFTYLRLLPYYVFSWFIWLMWLLLIPKNYIMIFWKIWLPILFCSLIIALLLFSWVQIALPSIDNALFWIQFFPLLWWIIWLIFLVLFISTYIKLIKWYNSSWDDEYIYSVNTYVLIWILSVLFVIVPLLEFFLWNWWWDLLWKLTVLWSNWFWYLIYFVYFYLLINLVLMIYKKVIYLLFSILDKETNKIWWHFIELAIYTWIIIVINNFLEISLTSIS